MSVPSDCGTQTSGMRLTLRCTCMAVQQPCDTHLHITWAMSLMVASTSWHLPFVPLFPPASQGFWVRARPRWYGISLLSTTVTAWQSS